MRALTFESDGAELLSSALGASDCHELEETLAHLPLHQPGIRLHGVERLRPLLANSGPVGAAAAAKLGASCRPVRAILFDKTASQNWSLPWHQDRTIAVAGRVDVPGFGPWTTKHGMPHVAPPAELLAGMITLRVHLDPVPDTNAPLLVAPASHRLGRIPEHQVLPTVERCGVAVCLAEAGDIWLYSTPILHASEVAQRPRRRRVLQVDYAVGELPGGLMWLGI